jgi:hypothetical protein
MGVCGSPPCGGTVCTTLQFCCNSQCCNAGEICCDVPGPVSAGARCVAPVNGTCPVGCNGCICNAEGTLIATPAGNRAIETLRAGDLVYSVDHGRMIAVPITMVHRTPVHDHTVMRVEFENGARLFTSPQHPTVDGRHFGEVTSGDRIDGLLVRSATPVPYRGSATWDILPASDTGAYYAEGVLIGSTLAPNHVGLVRARLNESVAPSSR